MMLIFDTTDLSFKISILDRSFPWTHLAFITKNSSVFDISTVGNNFKQNGFLMKLPEDVGYHGYSDNQGILYFFGQSMRKPVIKYHKKLNDLGNCAFQIQDLTLDNDGFDILSRQISKNERANVFTISIREQDKFINSITFGKFFWMFALTSVRKLNYCNAGKFPF